MVPVDDDRGGRRANRKVDAVTESIADGLSVVGLVVGFPLLLLGFMIALERLETWTLRDTEPTREDASDVRDAVDAAVADVERQPAAPARQDGSSVGGRAAT